MDDPDAPRLARDVTHAHIGSLLFSLRETVNEIIKLHLNPVGSPLVADEEGELIAIKSSLDFLLSDIQEARIAAARKLRIVSNA